MKYLIIIILIAGTKFGMTQDINVSFINTEYTYDSIIKYSGHNLLFINKQIAQLNKKQIEYKGNYTVLSEIFKLLLNKESIILRSTEDLLNTWNQWYYTDRFRACEDYYNSLKTMKFLNKKGIFPSSPIQEFFIREFHTIDCQCKEAYKNNDKKLIKKFKILLDKVSIQNNINESDISFITNIIDEMKKYPGRSLVGIQNETVAVYVLLRSDLSTLKRYIPIIKKAVKEKELSARYMAKYIDFYNFKKGLPQVYYTIETEKKNERLNLNEINKKRMEVGLPNLYSDNTFDDQLMLIK